MIRAGITYAALLLAGASIPALAVDNNINGRNWAATCTGCHGTNGHSEGGMPLLAGLDKAYIVNAMKEFKAGTRPATVMHQHAKGYSDEQIERIAEFFAAQPLK
ncbi:MAG TPA: c-type cytochrome [Burkholderiales bacterium]|nr:c-type cytochrome [Burkholderiales bacterium]